MKIVLIANMMTVLLKLKIIKIKKKRKVTQARRESTRKSSRKRYYRLKTEGICVYCGKEKATRGILCTDCHIRRKRRLLDSRPRYTAKEIWRDKGYCMICGNPDVAKGEKLCERCLKSCCENLKKAREMFKLKVAAGIIVVEKGLPRKRFMTEERENDLIQAYLNRKQKEDHYEEI